MNTATLELQMAGNQQFSQNAFQAAETGLERALQFAQSGNFSTVTPTVTAATSLPGSTDTFDSRIEFNGDNGITPVPAGGFSLGVSTGFQAYHFDITSTGTSRGATSTHTQSFYIVGPGGG